MTRGDDLGRRPAQRPRRAHRASTGSTSRASPTGRTTTTRARPTAALAALADHDLVVIHVESPDEEGHAGDVAGKIAGDRGDRPRGGAAGARRPRRPARAVHAGPPDAHRSSRRTSASPCRSCSRGRASSRTGPRGTTRPPRRPPGWSSIPGARRDGPAARRLGAAPGRDPHAQAIGSRRYGRGLGDCAGAGAAAARSRHRDGPRRHRERHGRADGARLPGVSPTPTVPTIAGAPQRWRRPRRQRGRGRCHTPARP